ncbi:MAG: FAD-binding oxidoreductase [Acidimicrobiia bacterium]|nr:FAD-binding oxidoreductase [Acidimicrobiia bacterium]
MAARTWDVLVVGGGVTGCSAAWHLAGYGAEVLLLEQFDLNTQASGRNAGSLHGQIQHGSFLEFGDEWGRAFLPALLFLHRSLDIWRGLGERLSTDLEVSLNGGLLIAETADQMRDIERKVAIERSAGVESDLLDRQDLAKVAPYVSSRMVGAQLSRVEGKANPMLAAPALARAAIGRGAHIQVNTKVLGLDWGNGVFTAITSTGKVTARRVVLVTGNSLNRFASLWGRPLPIMDDPAQVGATEPMAPMVHHLVYYAGGQLTFKQAKAGTLLIGGGWSSDIDPSTGVTRVNPANLVANMRVALRVVPSLAGVRLIRTWSGAGLATPDLSPIIARLGPPGLVVGVYPHMGLTAGPLLGRVLAQLALDRPSEVDLTPFAPDRF